MRQGLLLLLYMLKGCLKLFSDSDFEPKFRHFMMIFEKWLETDIIFSSLEWFGNKLNTEIQRKKMNWENHGRNYIHIYIYSYLLKYEFISRNKFLEYLYFSWSQDFIKSVNGSFFFSFFSFWKLFFSWLERWYTFFSISKHLKEKVRAWLFLTFKNNIFPLTCIYSANIHCSSFA